MSREEIKQLKGSREQVKIAKTTETKLKHDRAAKEVSAAYQGTKTSSPKMNMLPIKAEDTRYLRTKGIKQYENSRWPIKFGWYIDYNAKKPFRSMVIPIINIENKIRSCEYIYYDNNKCIKKFHAGGEKKGNFYPMGETDDIKQLYIVEGYATGASVVESLQCINLPFKYCVFVAFDAGSICAVVGNLRKKFSKEEIIVCTDDDEAGNEHADLACHLYNCKKVIIKGHDE